MSSRIGWFSLGGVLATGLLAGLYLLPPIRDRLEWRFDAAGGIVRGWLHPGDTLPTPIGYTTPRLTHTPAPTQTPAPTPLLTSTPTLTPTPLPSAVALAAPEWDKQDWNNCGPGGLAGRRVPRRWGPAPAAAPDRGRISRDRREGLYHCRGGRRLGRALPS